MASVETERYAKVDYGAFPVLGTGARPSKEITIPGKISNIL
jgi:hypothetical protein